MRTLYLLVAALILTPLAHAQESKPLLDSKELVAISRAALWQTTQEFNTLIGQEIHGKNKWNQKKLIKFAANDIYGSDSRPFAKGAILFERSDINKINTEYLEDKCAFNAKDLENLFSKELTLSDDETYAKKNRLQELRTLRGKQFHRLIYNLCLRAKERFESRLSELTFTDSQYRLNGKDVELISGLFFLPTDEGKVGLLQSILEPGIALAAVVLGGTVGTIIGLQIADLVLSIFYVGQAAGTVMESYHALAPELYTMNFPENVNPGEKTVTPLKANLKSLEVMHLNSMQSLVPALK